MNEKTLKTPIREEDLNVLCAGDIFFLSGYLITGRDDVHQRLIRHKKALPVDLTGKSRFSCRADYEGKARREREDTTLSPLGPRRVCAWKNMKRNSWKKRESK